MAGGYSNWEQEKMNRQLREVQAAGAAQKAAESQNFGTVKNTKRKTDWFGLAAAAVVVVVVVLILIFR